MGFVKDEEITALLSQCGVPSINLAQFDIDPGVVKLIPLTRRTNARSFRWPLGRRPDDRDDGSATSSRWTTSSS
jgi:hypothetical protein